MDRAQLIKQYGSIAAAARGLGMSRSTLREQLDRPQSPAAVAPTRLPVTADECWTLLDGWIGRKRIPF
jgi:lambda repressor-like predicted transcriptional regulator